MKKASVFVRRQRSRRKYQTSQSRRLARRNAGKARRHSPRISIDASPESFDVADIDSHVESVEALGIIPQSVPPRRHMRLLQGLQRILLRASGMVGVLLLAVVMLFFSATTILSYGPSPAARDLFVSTVMETSAAKFLAHMYFNDAQIETILIGNTAKAISVATNTDAITIAPVEETAERDGITVEAVRGNTFVGKMMIVNDPSRIFVKTLPAFDAYGEGMALEDMIVESGAIAGINAGGFLDPNGMGRGGMPMGVVIHEGKLLCETETRYPTIVGFDAEHKLIAGDFSAQEALSRGIREAVSFGPVLVSDGKVMPLAGGVNPRTAIGQRADGAVLLLVVDGRQPHSLGATHTDLANLMLQYGAVNAANLDGGSSSLMIHNGEVQNAYSMLTGPRKLPTAFLVWGTEVKPDAES